MIEFAATIAGLRSATDGGYKLTLDIPESEIAKTVHLMTMLRANVTVILDLLHEDTA